MGQLTLPLSLAFHPGTAPTSQGSRERLQSIHEQEAGLAKGRRAVKSRFVGQTEHPTRRAANLDTSILGNQAPLCPALCRGVSLTDSANPHTHLHW